MKIKFHTVAKKYLSSKIVSKHYHQSVLRVAKRCKYMTKEDVNNYIKKRLEKYTTITAKTDRTILLALWKFAYENDIIDHMPKNIVQIKQKKSPTKAWTMDECRNMVQNTFKYDNRKTRSGCSLGLFLRVWILIGYESGARFGDIFNFRHSDIESNILRWTMSKTGDPMTKILSDQCIKYINEIKSYNNTDIILGWVMGKRQALCSMKQFLTDSGLSGSSKFLRRSSATHIEMNNPGYAKLHLGHRTNGLAEKSYLDFGQIRHNTPIAPKLM